MVTRKVTTAEQTQEVWLDVSLPALENGVALLDELRKRGVKIARVLELSGPSGGALPAGLSYSAATGASRRT